MRYPGIRESKQLSKMRLSIKTQPTRPTSGSAKTNSDCQIKRRLFPSNPQCRMHDRCGDCCNHWVNHFRRFLQSIINSLTMSCTYMSNSEAAFIKILIEHELYLFMNGRLIYKRWLNTGQSFVFDIRPYSKYTYASITDKTIKPK